MSNKNSKFKSNNKFRNRNRVVRRAHFGRDGHLQRDARVYNDISRLDDILQPANSSILERNLEDVIDFTSADFVQEIEDTLLRDSDLADAFGNTLIVTDQGYAVNDDAQRSAYCAFIHTAIDDTTRAVIVNQNERYSREDFVREVKQNTLDRVDDLRQDAKATENKSFFGRLRHKFSEKINVSGRAVVNMFETAKRDMQQYAQKIADKAPSVKAKVLVNKWHRFKVKVAAVAVLAASTLNIACSNSNNAPQREVQQNRQEQVVQNPDTLSRSTQTAVNNTANVQTVSSVATDTVTVQTEYSDSLGISRVAWLATQEFDNNSFAHVNADSTVTEGYTYANQRLTDRVMKENFDSLTREQVLNTHRYIRSTYPNPEKLDELGVKDSVVINAATAAKQFDQFLNGCDENVPSNIADMFELEQIKGNLNKRATGIESPCDDAKVQYQSVQRHVSSIDEPVDSTIVAPTDSIVVTQADSTFSAANFVELGSVLRTDTIDARTDSIINVSATLNKSNEDFSDSQRLKSAETDEFFDLSPNDKTILAEKTGGLDLTQTTFDDIEETDTLATAPIDLTQTTFDDFVGVQDSTTSTSADLRVDSAYSEQTLSADSVITEILFDSDSVEIGTPSAGYVPERGGYNNSGVTEAQISYAKKILGEETYQAIIDTAPDEWFNKGNIAGGLTREELAVDIAVMNVTGPNQATTTAIMDAINCGTKIAEDMEEQVKSDIDGIHINKTRDGWTYNKPVYVRKVNNNGCGKKRTLDKVRAENRRATKASGPKFPRLYRKTTIVTQQAFVDLPSTLTTIYEGVHDSIVAPTYTLNKSNEDFSDSRFVRTATEEEVISRTPTSDKTVYVANEANIQPKIKASIARKRAAKQADRYVRQAKEAGLSGNMALDLYTEQGAEFVKKFVKENNTTTETIVTYQQNVKKAQKAALNQRMKSNYL